MWPAGVSGPHNYPLGRITLANDGTGTANRGSYDVTVFSTNGRVIRTGRVENWPRLAKSRMALLLAALKACGYDA
jgi:hypothetical protein